MARTAFTASAGEILQLIRSGRVRTRRELQELTGLSRSTLTLRLAQLIAAGYVREAGQRAGSTGRPASILSFDEAGRFVLAADLGATHARLALVDAGGHVHMQAYQEITIAAGPDAVLKTVTRRLRDLLHRSGRPLARVAGVGMGLPGPVDFATGRPNQPPLMPGWHDYPVTDHLAQALGVPAFVDNDANLMGLGEARAGYPGVPSLLFVKAGTGIGAGVILQGRAERGVTGGAGDIGHVRIAPPGADVRCACGAMNCLAAHASGGALARQLRERGVDARSSRDVVRLVGEGHPGTVELVRTAGRLLGEVLATSVALLNPAVLVIGGDMAGAGGHYLDGIRESVYERTVLRATRELVIAAGRVGDEVAVQGARHLVIDQTFSAEAVDARLASPGGVATG